MVQCFERQGHQDIPLVQISTMEPNFVKLIGLHFVDC